MSDEKAREILGELVRADHFCKFQLEFLCDSVGFFRPELVDKVRELLEQGVPKPDIITLLKEHVGRCSSEICTERERAHDELTALRAEVARLTKEREEVIEVLKETKALLQREQVKSAQVPEYLCQGPRCPEVARLREQVKELEHWKYLTQNNDPYPAAVATWRERAEKLVDSLDARDQLIRELLALEIYGEFTGAWPPGTTPDETITTREWDGSKMAAWERWFTAKRAQWESLKQGNAPIPEVAPKPDPCPCDGCPNGPCGIIGQEDCHQREDWEVREMQRQRNAPGETM